MKLSIIVLSVLLSSSAYSECSAPESAKSLADLISRVFDGSKVSCNDGNEFSTKFVFECKGDSFYSVTPDDNLNTLPDGSEVYIVNKLSEVDGQVKMTELVFESAEVYRSGEKPMKTLETNFISYSANVFGFYSDQPASAKSWLSSTWYLVEGQDKVHGYKIYADRAVTCSEI